MEKFSITEFGIFEALCLHRGARIEFYSDHVKYQGIIDDIIFGTRQVRLRHAKIIDGDNYMGDLRFKFNDITSIKVVEPSESVNRYPKNEYLLNILRNHQPERNHNIAKALLAGKLSDESDDEDIQDEFVLDLPEHLEYLITKDFAIINTIERFHRAVQSIANEKVIGVSFHGQEISRFGKLTWLCISTDICSFLFDIQELGKEAFDNGLKGIFESTFIEKVVHDCTFPSDCLAHQYSTYFNNVFDTRIADFVISVQRYSEKYKFHSYTSLDSLLRTYLNVPQNFIFQRETCQSNKTKRPITNAYLYDLLKSVLYLKLLKEKLSKELLTPFHKAVDFNRTFLVESDQLLIDSLGGDLSRPDRIPKSLLMHGIQTARFAMPQKVKNHSSRIMFIHPQTGEVINPYLDKVAANKTALQLRQQKREILDEKHDVNETYKLPTEEKKLSQSDGISEGSSKPVPYLGSLASLMDSIRKNKDISQELFSKKSVVYEQQAASEPWKNFLFTEDITKDLNNPTENFSLKHEEACLLEKNSFRKLDELYHELVYRKYDLEATVSSESSISSSDNKQYTSLSKSQSESRSESSEMWLKLREEIIGDSNYYAYNGGKKFNFIPG